MSLETPVLRIELDRVRETTMHMLSDRGEEINRMIGETLEKTLTEEWVRQQINDSVISCVESAIGDLADSYALQMEITRAIETMLVESIREKQEDRNV